jgi:hypothetical protein
MLKVCPFFFGSPGTCVGYLLFLARYPVEPVSKSLRHVLKQAQQNLGLKNHVYDVLFLYACNMDAKA